MLRLIPLILALIAGPALSHGYGKGETVIAHPYTFPTQPGGRSAAGYLTLMNNGTTPERLLEVRSPFARATLHTTIEEDGIAKMRPLEVIEVPGSQRALLAPGGMHIMFMGLGDEVLEVGETFTVTLVFERAGEVEVDFWVEARGDGMEEMDHSHHGHDDQSAVTVPAGTRTAIASALQETLRGEIGIAALAATESAAIAAWTHESQGGRALLENAEGTWRVAVLSGESLATRSGLTAHGLRRQAPILLSILAAAEEELPADIRAQVAGFDGTYFLR